jgi:hypothetical protein
MALGTDYSACQVNTIRLVYLALVGGDTTMPQVDITSLLARHYTFVISYGTTVLQSNAVQKHCL